MQKVETTSRETRFRSEIAEEERLRSEAERKTVIATEQKRVSEDRLRTGVTSEQDAISRLQEQSRQFQNRLDQAEGQRAADVQQADERCSREKDVLRQEHLVTCNRLAEVTNSELDEARKVQREKSYVADLSRGIVE